MMTTRGSDLAFGAAVHVGRFGVILGGLALAPLIGIQGWYAGLFVNVLCCLFAAGLVTYFGLWSRIGITRLWAGRAAALLVVLLLLEALVWILPAGLDITSPGASLWVVTLLLVGFNEELISRGVVLERLSRSYRAAPAVILTGALFGLQHLSLFATTDRGTFDILTNVLLSGVVGFAMAAFQYRFHWILPLILVHALADFTAIHTREPHGDAFAAATAIVFVGIGVLALRKDTAPKKTMAEV
ncbi:CPBP family intramembrane glutamic endopeptidase [Arthrobacter cheniae]|nr:CPBP family intramembrane glutamic endopeptidase [Arthrobacter cheniae]